MNKNSRLPRKLKKRNKRLTSYQWLRNGMPILGATSCSYTLTKEDEGKSITLKITGHE